MWRRLAFCLDVWVERWLGSEIQFLGFTLDCSINLWSNPDIALDHRLEKINIENQELTNDSD